MTKKGMGEEKGLEVNGLNILIVDIDDAPLAALTFITVTPFCRSFQSQTRTRTRERLLIPMHVLLR